MIAHLYCKMIQASVDKFLCFFAFHGYSSIINQPSCRSCARLIRDLRIVRCTRRHREQTISCTTSYRLGLFWRQNQFRGDLTQYTSSKSLCPNQRQIRGKSHCFIVLFIARLLSAIRGCRGCCRRPLSSRQFSTNHTPWGICLPMNYTRQSQPTHHNISPCQNFACLVI